MGGVWAKIFGKQEFRILILGLDAAGKTTVLYRLKLGEVVTTIPTIGFNVETLQYKHVTMIAWDVGGRDKIRPLLRHYYYGTDALIYVVDSNDRERLSDVRDELGNTIYESELDGVPLLVMANKQDMPNAMNVSQLRDELRLNSLKRSYNIVATVATTGDGLYDGMDWLSNELTKKNRKSLQAANKGLKTKNNDSNKGLKTKNNDSISSKDFIGKAWHAFKNVFFDF